MDYRLDLGVWNGVFVVPNILTDRFLRSANESQLKFILYLLRHPNRYFDEEIVCSETGISADEYKQAFDYWNEKGLLKAEGEKLVPVKEDEKAPVINKVDTAKETLKIDETVDEDKEEEKTDDGFVTQGERIAKLRRVAVNQTPSTMDPYYVLDRINSDQNLLALSREIETKLGGKLTAKFSSIIVSCVDDYGMDDAAVSMLFEWCIKYGKANVAYIEKVAKNWGENGITDYVAAERRCRELETEMSAWRKFCGLVGTEKRDPTDKEKDYVNTWINIWHMPNELIYEAYERCVERQGKIKVSYMNGILRKWHDSGYTSLSELLASEAKKRESKKKNETSYDVDELSSLTSYNYISKENESALVEKYKALADKNN